MSRKEALQEIRKNLLDGKRYARWFDYGVKYPFWDVKLYYNRIKKLWCWQNYGSSANKATLRELEWIITVIFKMSPAEFVKTYTVID